MGRGGYPPTVGFQGILLFFADFRGIEALGGVKAFLERAGKRLHGITGRRISPPIC
tara:strand:- start:14 stop:181 length:168 start_codon:yes stop_codon:yes gene_type:complete